MRGNQGISRLTSYYRCVSGDFRLSIGDMLICKFDTGGFKKGNFRTFPQGKYQVKYQSFLRYRQTTRLIDTIMAAMRKAVANRHLVCGNCSSWIHFDSLECIISWAEMRKSTSVFTCKGCTEVARLVGEVEYLRKMMESLKRMVTGQGLEEKRGETGDQEATLEVAEEKVKEKSVGEKTRNNSSTDNMDGKRIRPGAQMLATHDYKKNPECPVGNELDVNEGDTLVYLMTNEDSEHWCLAEDGKGQVGYVPATYLKIIRDVTRQEEESDTTRKEGYGNKTDGSKIGGDMGQDGERRKTYSAAVIEGFKRNSAIYVGDFIVRKTDSRLNKGEDVVVCLPGARIEHVTERE